ncbi:unnamed protein product [Phytophthora fragariaefolia]|uniref:Unnamed protein product n=1 Tax=Phytophthora fragariaefolia TaxID=1490495 RepID=A0A9W6XPN3_9STRA|nr:unnamed protein product [Phytophthora fragariaefolia]
MARPPLPQLAKPVMPRPPPSHLRINHRDTLSPRPRTLLPHFSSSNASSTIIRSSARPLQPEDFTKTPLERSIDKLQRSKARIRDSFARMNQTHELFEFDLDDTTRIVSFLEAEQRYITGMDSNLLDFSARQIQRCFRGHIGRRLFRQTVVVRAVLRIQREFREFHRRQEETRKKSRVLYRKVLRGLRGVRERHDLSHAELLTRVGHNLQVEAQWRKAMGVEDTESDLITALYRKKYIRRKLGAVFRQLYWLHSIVNYWQSQLPKPEPPALVNLFNGQESEQAVDLLIENVDEMDDTSPDTGSQRKIVIIAPRVRRRNGSTKKLTRGLNRDELLQRQRMTMRDIKLKKDNEVRKGEEAVKRIFHGKRDGEDSNPQSERNLMRKDPHKSSSNLQQKPR